MQPGLPKNICSSRLGFRITTGTAMRRVSPLAVGACRCHRARWPGWDISTCTPATGTGNRLCPPVGCRPPRSQDSIPAARTSCATGTSGGFTRDGAATAALGGEGQTVFVVPEKDLLIVTTAGLNGHAEIFRLIEKYILSSVDAQIR